MAHVIKPQRGPCRHVDFRGLGPKDIVLRPTRPRLWVGNLWELEESTIETGPHMDMLEVVEVVGEPSTCNEFPSTLPYM